MKKNSRLQQLNRYIANCFLARLPVFKFYGFKRYLLRNSGVDVEKNAKINGHVQVYGDGGLSIGSGTWIGPGCRFYTHPDAPIVIGSNCDIAPEVSFVTGSHEIGDSDRRAGKGTASEITIHDGCWIGTRVTLLGGVHVGKSSILAAGALVNKDIPENCIAAGVPAHEIKKLPS